MKWSSSIPERVLTKLHSQSNPWQHESYCVGFELQQWRFDAFADHIIEWMPDYALHEDELDVNHGNMYVRLKQAAARVYATDKYGKRGELGEIALHAICRDFFGTIPIAPRVFYKSSSNDVVKSFDMAHVRYLGNSAFEIWLGESKFYKSGPDAINAAIASITEHIDAGFLNHEKLILGPQVSKTLPHAEEIRKILSNRASLDTLFQNAVFPVCVACDSNAVTTHKSSTEDYVFDVLHELHDLRERLSKSNLPQQIRLVLIYIPLESKDKLAQAFDRRLKGLIVKD